MRFVWAVVAFVLAAGLVAMGIAQRTIFLGPDSQTITVSAEEDSPYTVIDSNVFDALPEALPGESGTLTIENDGPIFATYGRTADVLGWLSDQRFTHATADSGGIDVAMQEPTAEVDGDPKPRDPEGSDLWLEEFTADDSMEENFTFPEEMELSVLIASDGEAPAPTTIRITWPIDNSTPSAPWFIGFGIGVLLVGVVLYIMALVHSRRSKGPRRKGQPMPLTGAVPISPDRRLSGDDERAAIEEARPETEGEQDDEDDARPGPDDPDGPGDGAAVGGDPASSEPEGEDPEGGTARRVAAPRPRWRRLRLALPAIGLSAALLAGCAPDAPAPEPSPSASEQTEVDDDDAPQPAITEGQAQRIVESLAKTVAKADKENDADVAAKRLEGPALEMREVNYSLREDIKKHASLPQIPAEPIAVLLPQAYDGWPRSVLVVVEDAEDETVPPTILTLNQKDPWSRYKASYVAQLRPSAEIPDLAPSYQGAALVPPDSSFLQLAPEEVADAYVSILKDGEDSEYADLFDIEGDGFLSEVQNRRKKTLKNFNETGKETGKLTFGEKAGDDEPFALMTLHSGAIVGVSVIEEETVKPTEEDAVIRFEDDDVLQSLTGEENSAGGVRTTYLDQLFFFVPAQGSDEPIRLLGNASSIRGAKILEADTGE